MKTGNTRPAPRRSPPLRRASMEPGHEDREYIGPTARYGGFVEPQWSPVMKTGNT